MMTRASGTNSWTSFAIDGSDWTRLWTKKTWPPRASSRSSASLMTPRRNRRRRERQHVHRGAQLLHALLVGDAEPVLLVDDHEPEVLERDVLRQEAVRADHDVDGALTQPLDDRLLLLGRAEAGEELDLRRERRESIGERRPVLLGQHGRGHEHGDLHAVADRLERGAQRDLGLAVADVA